MTGSWPRLHTPAVTAAGTVCLSLAPPRPLQATALRREYTESALQSWLEGAEAGGGPAVQVQRTMAALQRLAQLLVQWGAPARWGRGAGRDEGGRAVCM